MSTSAGGTFVAGEFRTTRRYKLASGQGDLKAGALLKAGINAGELEFVTAKTDEPIAILVNDVEDLSTAYYKAVYIHGQFLGSGVSVAVGTTWDEYFLSARKNSLLLIEE